MNSWSGVQRRQQPGDDVEPTSTVGLLWRDLLSAGCEGPEGEGGSRA